MAIIPLDGFDFSPTSSYNPQHELCRVNAAPLRSADLACSPSLGLSRARASPQHGSLPTAAGLWLDSGETFPSAWLDLKVISSDHSHSVSPQSGSQTLHRCVNENDKRRREHRENTWGPGSFRFNFDMEIINWPFLPPSKPAFAHALCISERWLDVKTKLQAVIRACKQNAQVFKHSSQP